jgi:hypothetical protein
MDSNKITEIREKLINGGADKIEVDKLIDEVGKFATEMAVKATSEIYITKIKEAAEEGKAEYERKLKEENNE